MKVSIKKNTFRAIYRFLDKFSPINGDCGKLCNAICCTCDDESGQNMGIYLLPGEDKLFTGKEDWLRWDYLLAEDYEFPDSWHGKVFFLKCLNAPICDRNLRPIQCRTYPLTPHIDDNGMLFLIYQQGALPYECPLIEEKIQLNHDFVKATYTAWRHLLREPLIYDLVEMDSQYRIEEGEPITIVYP
jgi:hypothetical protein